LIVTQLKGIALFKLTPDLISLTLDVQADLARTAELPPLWL
jgi:hypothetical protein